MCEGVGNLEMDVIHSYNLISLYEYMTPKFWNFIRNRQSVDSDKIYNSINTSSEIILTVK